MKINLFNWAICSQNKTPENRTIIKGVKSEFERGGKIRPVVVNHLLFVTLSTPDAVIGFYLLHNARKGHLYNTKI